MGRHTFSLQYNPDNTGDRHPFRPGVGFSDDSMTADAMGSKNKNKKYNHSSRLKTTQISFVKAETFDFNEMNRQSITDNEDKNTQVKDGDFSLDDIDVIERELDRALERKMVCIIEISLISLKGIVS